MQVIVLQVAVQSLWNMRLAVFVSSEHESRVSHVNTASVKTGLGNTLGRVYFNWTRNCNYNNIIIIIIIMIIISGNKGAIGVSFLFNGTSFGFVNCHLTSGSEKVLRCFKSTVFTLHCMYCICTHTMLFIGIPHLYICVSPSVYVMSRRNQNFVDILRLLSLGDKHLGAFDISLRFTHLFWCGDLNYRLDLDVQVSGPESRPINLELNLNSNH